MVVGGLVEEGGWWRIRKENEGSSVAVVKTVGLYVVLVETNC